MARDGGAGRHAHGQVAGRGRPERQAKATLAGNRAPAGSFTVDVSAKPAQAHVDPKTGRVVREDQ
jgi:hypothetical protein